MDLSFVFTFEKFFIKYHVSISNAAITLGLGLNGAFVVSSNIPLAHVTWELTPLAVLAYVLAPTALGYLVAGSIGALVGALTGGVVMFVTTQMVMAIAGPTTQASLGTSVDNPHNPAFNQLAAFMGGGVIADHLDFDDIRVEGHIMLPDVVQIYRQVAAVQLDPGSAINLDTGHVWPIDSDAPSSADLLWDANLGLRTGPRAQMVRMGGRFATIGYRDTADALTGASTPGIERADIPLVSDANLGTSQMPEGRIVAIRTDVERVAKAIAWRDADGNLVLRYLVWDTSSAVVRIGPVWPAWSRTQWTRLPDTPPSGSDPRPIAHTLYAHRTQLTAWTNRMVGPLKIQWTFADTLLSESGAATIAGASLRWQQTAADLTIDIDLGESLTETLLRCEVEDANGVRASDSLRLPPVAGREDAPYTDVAPWVRQVQRNVHEAIQQWREQPVKPTGPEPWVATTIPDFETKIRLALKAGNPRIHAGTLRIR
jgi:hypothetical protein